MKVLYICGQEMILDLQDGGKRCANRNYQVLKSVYGEESVYAWIFTNTYREQEEHIHRAPSHSSLIAKIVDVMFLRSFYGISQEKELLRYIRQMHFDLVFLERSMYGPLLKKLHAQNIHTQVFVHNIEKNYVWNKVIKQNICFLLPYLSTKYNERMTFRYTDSYICLTQRDKDTIASLYHRTDGIVLPMTFADTFEEERLSQVYQDTPKKLLFIGSNFPPNYDGISWFIRHVMPKLPDYTLFIVGRNFEKCKTELTRQNVRVIGTVDDLTEWYYTNSIMVMPIRYGDGMKIKTAEAMMYGKLILASDEALAGYETDGVKGIYRCNSAASYVRTIRNLFDRYDHLGYVPAVRKAFKRKYTLEAAVRIYKEAFANEGMPDSQNHR